jgi:ABC-type nitrate/sulfonate/bicarbonate transport system substrate-binding protein
LIVVVAPMSTVTDISYLSVWELVDRYARRLVSPLEVMRDPLARSERRSLSASILLVVALVCGCARRGSSEDSTQEADGLGDQVLRYQGSAGVVTPAELAEDLGYLAPVKLSYVGNTISGPQDIQTVVTGDTDFGGAFNGAILKLIAAKAPIQAVIGLYGVDEQTWNGFFITDDSPVRGARDLIGKKISVNTLGAHVEFALKEYLSRSHLDANEMEQVTLVVIPPVNGEQALRQKQVDVATLGSIFREKAVERGGIHPLFTDFELFGSFTAGSYVMTKKLLRERPATARKFVEATARAIEWARKTPRAEVIARFESIVRRRGRNEDPSSLQYWRSTGVASAGGTISVKDFQRWIDWLVKAGELRPGQVDARDVYTNELNPYAQ